jgi:hypothetical protein
MGYLVPELPKKPNSFAGETHGQQQCRFLSGKEAVGEQAFNQCASES